MAYKDIIPMLDFQEYVGGGESHTTTAAGVAYTRNKSGSVIQSNIITFGASGRVSVSPGVTRVSNFDSIQEAPSGSLLQQSLSSQSEGSYYSEYRARLAGASYFDYLILDKPKIVEKRVKPSHGCAFYDHVQEFAANFIDDILGDAIETIRIAHGLDVVDDTRRFSTVRNVVWPTAEHFTVEAAAEKLKEYIDFTSEVNEDWVYALRLVSQLSNRVSDFYCFEAKFSIPSPIYPVPQATASVFFHFEVSRIKPKHCPVDVTFQIESFSSLLVPGKAFIHENMLFRVIDAKLAFFKKFRF